MNNDLEKFSEERLIELAEMCESKALGFPASHAESAALARIALSVKQAKPVAWKLTHVAGAVSIEFNKEVADLFGIFNGNTVQPLCTTPQPAHTEQDGWIKCSERMPDSKNDVQLFCSDTREQFVGFHRGNGMFQFFNMNDVIGECEPTHWMPLPAAPKPESER